MKIVYDWLKEFVDVAAPATDLREKLSLAGVSIDSVEDSPAGPVLDAEVTANRPDCLGHYGVAREVAAIYRLPVKSIDPKLKESSETATAADRVEIESPELCGRYTARVLRGVKVQPSPDWLRKRLEAIGEKSINNVVDVTNYVMFELGQPLHAFDLEKLNGQRIVVRRAKPAEKMRTLDGAERTLTKEMCVIADASHAVAIAGVMGGAESEISFSTRNLLIESAWFDPISIRRTSKALGLRTEASYRFERGSDPEMAELASRRAAELIQQVAGGELLAGVIDVYPGKQKPLAIELSRRELLRVLGADVPDRDIEEILRALGFALKRIDPDANTPGSTKAVWNCEQPSWRRDVTRGIDLVEEVARHYGYDKFPPRLPPAKQPAHRLPHASAMDGLRERVVGLGYQEIVAIPIVDTQRDEIFRPEGITPAIIGNPLAEDAAVMRSSGVVSMISALEWNINRGQRNLRLFETGKRYELRDGAATRSQPAPIAAMVASGQADVGMATETLAEAPGLDSIPVFHWEHVLVVPEGHPLARLAAHPARLTIKELGRYPIVTYEMHFSGRSRIDAAFAAAGIEPSIVLEAIDADVIKTYARAGLGVGIVAGLATEHNSEGLVVVHCGHLFGRNTTRLAVKQGAYLRGFVYAFIEMVAPGWDKRRLEEEFSKRPSSAPHKP